MNLNIVLFSQNSDYNQRMGLLKTNVSPLRKIYWQKDLLLPLDRITSVPNLALLTIGLVDQSSFPDQSWPQIMQKLKEQNFSGPLVVITRKKELISIGSDLTLTEDDLFNTSYLDYYCLIQAGCKHLPITPEHLVINSNPPFDVYYQMPLQNKFLKVFKKDHPILKEKWLKFSKVPRLYIHRQSIDSCIEYTRSQPESDQRTFVIEFEKIKYQYQEQVLKSLRSSTSRLSHPVRKIIPMIKDIKATPHHILQREKFSSKVNNPNNDFFVRNLELLQLAVSIGKKDDRINLDRLIEVSLLAPLSILNLPPQMIDRVFQNDFHNFTPSEQLALHKTVQETIPFLEKQAPLTNLKKQLIPQINDMIYSPSSDRQYSRPLHKETQVFFFSQKLFKFFRENPELPFSQIKKKTLSHCLKEKGHPFEPLFLKSISQRMDRNKQYGSVIVGN